MGRYRKVDCRIWNDAKFCRLSDAGKLAFLFVLTHPNMTGLGAMRATIPGLAAELGWTLKAFREAFGEAFGQGMIEGSEKACFVALPNFLKYNPPESPNVIKGWAKVVDLLPECDAKSLCLQRAKAFAEGLGKAFAEAFAKTMPYPKPKPKQEQEKKEEPDSDESKPADLSDSASCSDSDPAAARVKAQLRYIAAVGPLIGRTDGAKHPLGSPQAQADQTCIRRWWSEVIWPEDDDNGLACRARLATFIGWCSKASSRKKPMAWLSAMVKRQEKAVLG